MQLFPKRIDQNLFAGLSTEGFFKNHDFAQFYVNSLFKQVLAVIAFSDVHLLEIYNSALLLILNATFALLRVFLLSIVERFFLKITLVLILIIAVKSKDVFWCTDVR